MEQKSVEELAEQIYPAKQYEIGSGHPGGPYSGLIEKQKAFIKGYQAGQASKALPLNQELTEALKRISDQIFNLRVKHPSIEAELYPVEMDVYNLMDRIDKAVFQKAEGLVSQPAQPVTDDDLYESIYMEVVKLVEKDNIQCEEYLATVKKLQQSFSIQRKQATSLTNSVEEEPKTSLSWDALITYIYDFAWHYGRLWHTGDAEKIKAAIAEKFQLPEEFLKGKDLVASNSNSSSDIGDAPFKDNNSI